MCFFGKYSSVRGCVRAGVLGTEETAVDDDEVEEDRETLHRLCPTYAQDINSPLRHVRTRIYFTSESHMHSLINVLRFAHLCKRTLPPDSCLSVSVSSLKCSSLFSVMSRPLTTAPAR